MKGTQESLAAVDLRQTGTTSWITVLVINFLKSKKMACVCFSRFLFFY